MEFTSKKHTQLNEIQKIKCYEEEVVAVGKIAVGQKKKERRFFILSLKNATKSLHAYTSIWHISKQTQEGTIESRM